MQSSNPIVDFLEWVDKHMQHCNVYVKGWSKPQLKYLHETAVSK